MMEMFHLPVTPDEETAVAAFLAGVAETAPGVRPALPDAERLWLEAQLLRRWDAERAAQTPLDAMEPLQFAAGLAAAAMLVWPVASWLESLAARLP